MQAEKRPAPGRVKAPDAPPFERRRAVPADWGHSDTLALELAHELIQNYTGCFSAEFATLLDNPEAHAERIAAIRRNDQRAEADIELLASFDKTVVAKIITKYGGFMAEVHAIEGLSPP